MKEKLQEILAKLRSMWENASKKARIILLLSIAGLIVVLALFVAMATHVDYVAVSSNLSPQESASILSVLGEMNVEPKVSATGDILVPEKDANRVMMQIATKINDNFSYDIYQKLGITATQADKNQAQIYQLQNRLQGVIETFDEISQAVVTLSIPQPSIYALQGDTQAPTASVKLLKRPGRQLTSEQVQGILNLVKYSVSGLTEDNISISDESGDLKSSTLSAGSVSTTKLNLVDQVNSSVRSRILSVLTPVFGEDNIQVAVNSVLDTDPKTTQTTTYIPHDPDNPRNNPVDYEEIERDKYGGGDGAAQGVPGANDNINVPQYSAQSLDVTDADSYSARDVIDYLVSSVREDIVKEGLEITDLTVAVVINADTLPEGRKDQVIDLVVGASGVTAEKIKVQNMRFYDRAGIIDNTGISLQRILILTGIAVLALAVISIVIILSIRKKHREREAMLAAAGELSLMGDDLEYEPIQLVETKEQKLRAQIRDLADSDPEIVAQLIKTWLLS